MVAFLKFCSLIISKDQVVGITTLCISIFHAKLVLEIPKLLKGYNLKKRLMLSMIIGTVHVVFTRMSDV